MNTRCLSLILLLLLCAVPLASAGGMAKVYLSPAEASWKTGQTVQVKVMYDNNLNPIARDISLYFDWNAQMLRYESCDFKVGHSTVAGLLSSHELNVMVGDFTDGYKNGDYPLAVLTFTVIGPGDTPIEIRVARLNDMDGKPATFVTGKGTYSISGDTVANPGTVATPRSTTLPAAGQPTVIVVTPGVPFSMIPTIQQSGAYQPVAAATTLPPVQAVATTFPTLVGGAPGWPVLTPGATIPTPYPTTVTVETTIPTPLPTTVVTTTVPTTVPTTEPTTTVLTTFPTPTPEPTTEVTTVSPIAYQTGNLGVSYGIPINDTPTPEETPLPERTLPSPLSSGTNLTEDPVADWPEYGTPTVTATPYVRSTLAPMVVNNSSAAAASATGGSGFGDAWMMVLAAVAGVALVALGVVYVQRKRDDGWL